MECHPDSDETFEPIMGRAVMFVSTKPDRSSIEAFYLDSPVVLFKGIWHGLIRIDEEAHIKIIENTAVRCTYWPLRCRMDVSVWSRKNNRG